MYDYGHICQVDLSQNEMQNKKSAQRKHDRAIAELYQTNVSYVNLQSKQFNQKISKNYKKDTAKICQNLEHGTTL